MNQKKDEVNILMAINQSFLPHLITLLYSISENINGKFNIYLMHSELTKEQLIDLKLLCNKLHVNDLNIINIENSFLKNVKLISHFSMEMYYRIFAADYLPSKLDRILWLDADIIVNKSLYDLYSCDFEGKSIIACAHREKDESSPVIKKEAIRRLSLSRYTEYFNSGVLLLNLNKIRKTFRKDDILKLLFKYQSEFDIKYPDQDLLNILYQNDVKIIDKYIFNYQIHHNWNYKNEKNWIMHKAVIIHYVGPAKPWKYTTRHFSYSYYWKYYLKHGKFSKFLIVNLFSILYCVYGILKKVKRS